MRPLPRVHAYTNAELLSHRDLGIRAASIAAAGSAVALHARAKGESAAFLTASARRLITLARPPEAAVLVSGRPDIAAGVGAQGVQLGREDMCPTDARQVLTQGWIGRSVHNKEEAALAVREGADFLVVGSVYPTASHPGEQGVGPDFVRQVSKLKVPVIAIGGITPERAWEVHSAGAYGVAAIAALWHASDPAAATLALLEPWVNEP